MLSILCRRPEVGTGGLEVAFKISSARCSTKIVVVVVFEVSLAGCCLAEAPVWRFTRAACLACLRVRALYSRCNSLVSKAVHVLWTNWRSLKPNALVALSKESRSKSWCTRSFANPCQWAMVKSSPITAVLWGSGNRPSNTGIAHWKWHSEPKIELISIRPNLQQILKISCCQFL